MGFHVDFQHGGSFYSSSNSRQSDWTGNTYQDKRYLGKYNSAFGGGSQYAYYHEEEEDYSSRIDSVETERGGNSRHKLVCRFSLRHRRIEKGIVKGYLKSGRSSLENKCRKIAAKLQLETEMLLCRLRMTGLWWKRWASLG